MTFLGAGPAVVVDFILAGRSPPVLPAQRFCSPSLLRHPRRFSRDDGARQWAYKGKPLYIFVKDRKAGDIKGDSFLGDAWHIAKP